MEKIEGEEGGSGCRLCPRNCGALRGEGELGFCGQSDRLVIARAALHYWEEPCISGSSGSGTVFFSGCSLRCVFCQNASIAGGRVGKAISRDRLAEIFLELQEKGANNINLVTAGHFVPQLVRPLREAKRQGLIIPIVYNSSCYEKVSALRQLEGLVDVYLPDFKYVSSRLSARYSRARDYFSVASRALAEMVRQTGEPRFYRKESPSAGNVSSQDDRKRDLTAAEYNRHCDEPGELLMRRGTLVRHLLLPGATEDSMRVLDYLYHTYGDRIFLSIMNQYTPMPGAASFPELGRRLTDQEYEKLVDYALFLGIENAFTQEGDVAEASFIPNFDAGEGI